MILPSSTVLVQLEENLWRGWGDYQRSLLFPPRQGGNIHHTYLPSFMNIPHRHILALARSASSRLTPFSSSCLLLTRLPSPTSLPPHSCGRRGKCEGRKGGSGARTEGGVKGIREITHTHSHKKACLGVWLNSFLNLLSFRSSYMSFQVRESRGNIIASY